MNYTAHQLQGRQIRIECLGKIPTGRNTRIIELESGELVENVTRIELTIIPRGLITAQLTLLHIGKMEEQPDGSSQAPVREETLTVESPEIDLTAFTDVV